jgi:hypothetical protein
MSLQKLTEEIKTDQAFYGHTSSKQIQRLLECVEVLRAELDQLGNHRDSCKLRYDCCSYCGNIYSAELALDIADKIALGDGNG